MTKRLRAVTATVLAVIMAATPVYASENKSPRFSTRPEGSAQGRWTDKENLTWTFWDDEKPIVIGNGPKYSDLHPEITDREYLLKEYVNYPGEGLTNLNQWGEPKANFEEDTLQLLKEFVNSFDWINSDELTRVKMIYNRIACGQNGNSYGSSYASKGGWLVLRFKQGICQDYAAEFQRLARIVGLECVEYKPYSGHISNMIKINGQWIVVDPTVDAGSAGLFLNTETFPVDYEAELNRYPKEQKQRDLEDGTTERREKNNALEDQYWRGEITYEELEKAIEELYKK